MGERQGRVILHGRNEQTTRSNHEGEALCLLQDIQRAKLEWLRASTELVQLQIGNIRAAMRPKDPPPGMYT